MSLFNEEQQSYMAYLASRPAEKRCYCGWYDAGKCPNCPPHLTCADKLARQCPHCHNSPWADDLERPIVHRKGCAAWPNGGQIPKP